MAVHAMVFIVIAVMDFMTIDALVVYKSVIPEFLRGGLLPNVDTCRHAWVSLVVVHELIVVGWVGAVSRIL
ncbi:hypothetical protein BKA70DRAFT_1285398, partial [Coprinopsis sp. MPI-PUGE-AT-0042]